jgi:hypothetical protein
MENVSHKLNQKIHLDQQLHAILTLRIPEVKRDMQHGTINATVRYRWEVLELVRVVVNWVAIKFLVLLLIKAVMNKVLEQLVNQEKHATVTVNVSHQFQQTIHATVQEHGKNILW